MNVIWDLLFIKLVLIVNFDKEENILIK